MTAKQYLLQLKRMEEETRSLKEELSRLEEDRCYLSALGYGTIGGAVNKKCAAFERPSDRIIDLTARVGRRVTELAETRGEILRLISQLRYPYSRILTLRYVDGRRFEEIADALGYTYSGVTHAHGQALEEFARLSGLTAKSGVASK